MKYLGKLPTISITNTYIYVPKGTSTTVEIALQIRPFMQNKANFPYFSPGNEDYAKKQTQFKAKQTQFWANIKGVKAKQTQFKPKQTQFIERVKTSGLLKYTFPHSFLIKSRPKIAENREIMAFTILKRPGNHEKAVKNPIW
jgi:hypothetical protein